MEEYLKPVMDIIEIEGTVITDSNCVNEECDNELPIIH